MQRSDIYILGISAYYHDSAAALIKNGKIVAAAQEERFTRKKHDPNFPKEAVRYCLQEAHIELSDLEAIVFYDKPFLKFERLLETYHQYSPQGLKSFLMAIPVWIKEKLFQKKFLKEELNTIGNYKGKIFFSEHHLSHAASAFYPSPFDEAAILTLDGVGEWATTVLGKGSGNDIELLQEIHFPHSLGLLYSAFTYYCGFKVNSGEYKLMGLAPYGNPDSPQTKDFIQKIKDELIDLREDGSFLLNMDYFNYPVGLTMTVDKKWEQLFGLKRREAETNLDQETMNLALAIQIVTEEAVENIARHAREKTGCQNLVLAGGVALNCVSNGKILRKKIFDKIWIQPAAGDAGGALGAALSYWHLKYGKDFPKEKNNSDLQAGSYLGPQFSDFEIQRMAESYEAPYVKYNSIEALSDDLAKYLDEGNVVGWFQGRMEFGPRALGNRSILGDPRKADMQKKINLKIKYREGFRPFAPAVLEEDIQKYFDLDSDSPYMLIVAPVKDEIRKTEPENYNSLEMFERLYHQRSDLPAITHIDYSARVQSVNEKTNPEFSILLRKFKEHTGCSVLINTSFNVRGEPVVCKPKEAYDCFMRTEMDYLVVGNYLFKKSDQKPWDESLKGAMALD